MATTGFEEMIFFVDGSGPCWLLDPDTLTSAPARRLAWYALEAPQSMSILDFARRRRDGLHRLRYAAALLREVTHRNGSYLSDDAARLWPSLRAEYLALSTDRLVKETLLAEAARLGIPGADRTVDAIMSAFVTELLPGLHAMLACAAAKDFVGERDPHERWLEDDAATHALPLPLRAALVRVWIQQAASLRWRDVPAMFRAIEAAIAETPEAGRAPLAAELATLLADAEPYLRSASKREGQALLELLERLCRALPFSWSLNQLLQRARWTWGIRLAQRLSEVQLASIHLSRGAAAAPDFPAIVEAHRSLRSIARTARDLESVQEQSRFVSSEEGAALARERREALMLEIATRIGLPPTTASREKVERALEALRSPGDVARSSEALEEIPAEARGLLADALKTPGPEVPDTAILAVLPSLRPDLTAAQAFADAWKAVVKGLNDTSPAPRHQRTLDRWVIWPWVLSWRDVGFKAMPAAAIALFVAATMASTSRADADARRAAREDAIVTAYEQRDWAKVRATSMDYLSASTTDTVTSRGVKVVSIFRRALLEETRRLVSLGPSGDADLRTVMTEARALDAWVNNKKEGQ